MAALLSTAIPRAISWSKSSRRPECPGDWHCIPVLVRAPHRRLRCMGNLLCMGLFLRICLMPSPRMLHVANNRLPTCIDVDMLDRDLLLAFAAMAVERFKKGCVSSRKLAGLGRTFIAPTTTSAERPSDKRLAAMSEAERARYDRWLAAHRPGPPGPRIAARTRPRQDRAARALVESSRRARAAAGE